MASSSEWLRIVDRIYEGAVSEGGWERVLSELADLLRAQTALAATFALPGGNLRASTFVGVEASYQRRYGALTHLPDQQGAWRRLAELIPALVATDEAIVPGSGLLESELYNDWMRPQGMRHHIVALLTPTRADVGGWFFTRSASQGAFDAETVGALRMLHPHIARAVQVQLRLASANLLKARALDALDRCSDGVLFVTLEGVVLWANGRAESILTANEGLRIIRKVLTCSRASESDALRRSIASCATNHDGGGGVIAVHRTVGRPLSVLVAALRGEPPFALEPIPAAIVFVTDPDRLVVAPRSHLRDLYGLTEAEARAADAVLDARGLSDIADKLGVSLSTVRTLLQRAFEKTDTHRQSELVQLLLAHRVPFIEK